MRAVKSVSELAVTAVLVSGLTAGAVAEPVMELLPVAASGSHTIVDNEITLTGGGQVVEFDVYVRDWDPTDAGVLVSAWQSRLDCTGYTSGTDGMLTAVADEFTPGPRVPFQMGIDTTREDYIFYDLLNFDVCNHVDCCNRTTAPCGTGWPDVPGWYTCASAVMTGDAVADPHTPVYLNTYALEVPPDAEGTFTVGLDTDPNFLILNDQNGMSIDPITTMPVLITVNEGPVSPVFEMVPVRASGGPGLYTVEDNEIILSGGGQIVEVDVYVRDWDLQDTGVLVKGWQTRLDCAGYTSGTSGTLTPVDEDFTPGPGVPYQTGIDATRSDYMFHYASQEFEACNVIAECEPGVPGWFMCMSAVFTEDAVADPHTPVYVNTYSFEVPTNASGTFTIELDSDPDQTVLADQNSLYMEPLTLLPVLITVMGTPSDVTLEMVPVRASGGPGAYTIEGDEIILNGGGQIVEVDVYVRDWDPEDEGILLGGWQTRLDCAGYTSGTAGTLTAVDDDFTPGPGVPFEMGIDTTRADYVFHGLDDYEACNSVDECEPGVPGRFGCMSVVFGADSVADPHTPVYVNTYSFEVPYDAEGTFTVDLNHDPQESMLKDENALPIGPIAFSPVLITVTEGPPPPSPTFEMIPVRASGGPGAYTIEGDEIILNGGGQIVEVDVYVRDWDPDDEGILLGGWQTRLDCAGYTSGTGGTLTAVDDDFTPGPGVPFEMGIDTTRADYVFHGLDDYEACNSVDECEPGVPGRFGCMSVVFGADSVADPHTPVYVNTYSFEVPYDAEGTFTVDLNHDPQESMLKDENALPIGPIAFSPVLITVTEGPPPPSPTFEMIPVRASGGPGAYTIEDNEILLAGGGQWVEVDLYARNWDPAELGILVAGWQSRLDCSGYVSGDQGTIEAVDDDFTPGPHVDFGMGVDASRPDYIFSGMSEFPACNSTACCDGTGPPCGPEWPEAPGRFSCFSATLDDGTADEHVPAYVNTYSFWVPVDAAGTFTITLDPDESVLEDQDLELIEPLLLIPFQMTIAAVPPLPEDSLGETCTLDSDCYEEARCVQGICYVPKQRYLSMARNPAQVEHTARRITFDNGELIGWVGEPDYAPPTAQHDGLWLAHVVTEPYYAQEWPDLLHVMGCEIAHAGLCDVSGLHCDPNSCPGEEICVQHSYHVQTITLGQDIGNEDSYSLPLVLHMPSTWADTVSTCAGNHCEPPNGVVGLDDIMASIKLYQGTPVAPVTWLDIDPSNVSQIPDQIVGLGDIMSCIAGFQDNAYPGHGPLNCP